MKTKQGNRFIIVITDCDSTSTRALPIPKATESNVSVVVLENRIMSYGIPRATVTDSGSQFVSKIFAALCASVGTKLATTTECHPQATGQVERLSKTLVARLRHYISEHQTSWDTYVQPLTYGCNTQVHRTTNTSPFTLELGEEPPRALVSEKKELQRSALRCH